MSDLRQEQREATRARIERTNDYQQAGERFLLSEPWERDDLVRNMGDLLSQCERDVQERMLWHFFLIHDDYGTRVGKHFNMTANDVKHLKPLATQILTADEQKRIGTFFAQKAAPRHRFYT